MPVEQEVGSGQPAEHLQVLKSSLSSSSISVGTHSRDQIDAMQTVHANRAAWVSQPSVYLVPSSSTARGLQASAREQSQKRGTSLGRSLVPDQRIRRQQRETQPSAAVPLPVVDIAADVSYYLQLASFAVLGGFVIYFTLNYVGLNITLNKVKAWTAPARLLIVTRHCYTVAS